MLVFLMLTLIALLLIGGWTVAKLSDVQDSLTAQTAAIQVLTDALAVKPPAAATEADLDAVKSGIDANTAAIQAIPTV